MEDDLLEKALEVKESLSIMVIRDLLIEHNLITQNEFRERILEKAKLLNVSKEILEELKRNV